MNQIPLLNTNLMASHKELARIVRDRRLSEYKSSLITAGNTPAPAAAAPVDSATTLPCGSLANESGLLNRLSRTPLPEAQTGEFNLPDEDRNFHFKERPLCPGCGLFHPVMQRRIKGKRALYRLVCWATTDGFKSLTPAWKTDHCLITDWLPSSQQAIAVWTMVARLSK